MVKYQWLASILHPFYKALLKVFNVPLSLPINYSGQNANDLIKKILSEKNPVMIARFGETELRVIVAYLNMKENIKNGFRNILRRESFNFDKRIKERMSNAGILSDNDLEKFAELMLKYIPYVDLLGCWLPTELRVKPFLKDAVTISFGDLLPFNFNRPWTSVLKGKKVLIIHPFVQSIKNQYDKKELLFKNKDILPNFELKILKSVIYNTACAKSKFPTWFDALEFMCNAVDKIDFDIAIIGAGPFGFPLAAHIKSTGKKAIYLGGATQLLFGIKGKRWDNTTFAKDFYNEYWVRPSEAEIKGLEKVEFGCYT